MTRSAFYTLVTMAAFLGAIRMAEVMLYDSCQADQLEVNYLDIKLASARKLNVFNAQLLRQLVIDSHTDPVLAELLIRHHVKVVDSPSPQDASPAANLPAPAAPGGASPAPPEDPAQP